MKKVFTKKNIKMNYLKMCKILDITDDKKYFTENINERQINELFLLFDDIEKYFPSSAWQNFKPLTLIKKIARHFNYTIIHKKVNQIINDEKINTIKYFLIKL